MKWFNLFVGSAFAWRVAIGDMTDWGSAAFIIFLTAESFLLHYLWSSNEKVLADIQAIVDEEVIP